MSSNPMATHGAASWIEHKGADPAAARRFYEKVLGWSVAEMPMKDGGTYPGIMVGDAPIGGISPTPSETGAWTIFITVDDVDRRFRSAVKEGATAVQEPFSVPGVGRIANVKDPFGAAIAFIAYEQPGS